MDPGQTLRRLGRGIKAAFLGFRARAGDAADKARAGAAGLPATGHHVPRWLKIAGMVVLLVVLFYPLRACWVSEIDDDSAFWPAHVEVGQSATVAVIAALLDREVNDHGWVVNSPGFTPTGLLLDDMPNYQRGIVAGLARFSLLLKDRIARIGLVIDPDLAEAADKLAYPPDVWLWDWSQSIWPTGSSGGAYADAMEALQRFNARLAARQAVYAVNAANLAAVLDGVIADLDASANRIDAAVMGQGELRPSETFYRTKGAVYAEYLALEGIAKDFAIPLAAHRALPAWNAMMADLKAAAEIRSGAVRGGAPGVLPQPCDLCTQGFFILRARIAMARVAQTLRKSP